jgi:hypothetical protein
MGDNLRFYHKVLRQISKWHGDKRVTQQRNLALTITGIFLSMAVQLSAIVAEWPVAGKTPSLTNRLRRFLSNERLEVQEWYQPLAQSLLQVFAGKQLRLVVDSSKVGFGYTLLMIGLAYRKRCLPLVWSVHNNKGKGGGHVLLEQQVALFRRLRPLIPRDAEVWVLGDSGFEQVPLLQWIRRQGWQLVIRQRGNLMVWQRAYGWRRINRLPLEPGQTRAVGWVRLTKTHNAGWYWLVLHWAVEEDKPWYLVSSQPDTRQALRLYGTRMWIEEMFGDMKGHGFDLEETHLRQTERIERLVLAVSITFVWFLTLGTWVVKRGLRHLVDRKDRRDKSYFRLGWDWLRRCRRLGAPFKLHFRPYL